MATIAEAGQAATAMPVPRRALLTPRNGVVLASVAGTSISLSQSFLSVFGVAMVPIAQEFGWPRSLVAGVMAFTVMKSVALAFAVGWLVDRFGPRRVLTIAMVLYALGIVAFALSPAQVLPFYISFAIVCALGAPLASTTYGKSLAGWFDKGRGTMMGFSAGLGTGIGSAGFPILTGILLPHFGWRGAFLGSAAVVLLVVFPIIVLLFRDAPATAVTTATRTTPIMADDGSFTLKEVLRNRVFWTLVASIGLCAGCMTAMFTQVVPVVTQQGFTMAQGVAVVTVFATVCSVWQWLMGYLIDKVARPTIVMPFYLLGALGLWLIHHSQTFPMLLLSGGLMGLSLGAEYSALPLLLSRYFGVRYFGTIASVVYAAVTVAVGFIPVGMNAIFDLYGSYDFALNLMEICMLIATALILLLPNCLQPVAKAPAATTA